MGHEAAEYLKGLIGQDLDYFREEDPASREYTDAEILSVRRGMTAIAAHRIFRTMLDTSPDLIYDVEVIAKAVQRNTNVEIHPLARIASPFGIDHGHGTVIGATSRIGHHTFIYHGVTLGATGRKAPSGRRHPKVGSHVFLGNGSQLLGPTTVEDYVALASGTLVVESYLGQGVKLSPGVRLSKVVVPTHTHVYGYDPENPRRYWVELEEGTGPKWVTFERFDACGEE
jgi:serine O-acetyltransferase